MRKKRRGKLKQKREEKSHIRDSKSRSMLFDLDSKENESFLGKRSLRAFEKCKRQLERPPEHGDDGSDGSDSRRSIAWKLERKRSLSLDRVKKKRKLKIF